MERYKGQGKGKGEAQGEGKGTNGKGKKGEWEGEGVKEKNKQGYEVIQMFGIHQRQGEGCGACERYRRVASIIHNQIYQNQKHSSRQNQ